MKLLILEGNSDVSYLHVAVQSLAWFCGGMVYAYKG